MRNLLFFIFLLSTGTISAQLSSSRFFPQGNDPAYYALCNPSSPIGRTSDSGYFFNYNYAAAGFETGGPQRGYIIRTDSLLTPLWQLTSLVGNGPSLVLNDGSILVRRFNNSVERYYDNGQSPWSRMFTPAYGVIRIDRITYTSSGTIVLTGDLSSPMNSWGGYDYWHGLRMEIDTAGNLLSADTMVTWSSNSRIDAITYDGTTRIITGTILPAAFVSRQTGNVSTSWTKTLILGSSCAFGSSCILADSSVIVLGSYHMNALDDAHLLLLRISASGNLVWAKSLPNDKSEPQSITRLPNGHLLITGFHAFSLTDSLHAMMMEIDTSGNITRVNKVYQRSISPPFASGNGNYLFAGCGIEPNAFTTDSLFMPDCTVSTPTLVFTNPLLSLPNSSFITAAFTPTVDSGFTLTPQSCTFVDTCDLATLYAGVTASPGISSIHIFPNPAEEWMTIEGLGSEKLQLEIRDMNGKPVAMKTVNANEATISLSGLPSGVYYLRLLSTEAHVFHQEIFVHAGR